MAPPEAGAAFKDLSIKRRAWAATDHCKSFDKEEITSVLLSSKFTVMGELCVEVFPPSGGRVSSNHG